ncbi:MAG TPA: gliding motility-associated C-terminal domain-containing protein, partial [Phaeodactylibacter sp.]|nr:gliding motility-associated C-terminal domain-containing protein [Phaeodactylibacter sp.]
LISSSSSPTVTYEWTDANGNVLGTGAVLTNVTQEGVYTVQVTDTQTGCTASEDLQVMNNISYPAINVNPPNLIDCNTTVSILDGSGSAVGSDIIYLWTGPGLSGSPNALVSEANAAGTYTLQVLNTSNGCSSEESIVVEENMQIPDVFINNPEELDCQVTSVLLDGNGSTIGSDISYLWINANNDTLATGLQIEVTNAGVYQLIVTNDANGCTAMESVEVSQNGEMPQGAFFEINDPNCAGDASGYIVVSDVLGGTPPYNFSLGGSTYSNDNFYPQLTAGEYAFSIEDANGCQWDTMIVVADPEPIEIDLGDDISLSFTDSALIHASVNLAPNEIDTIIWWPATVYDCENEDCSTISIHTYNSMLVAATVIDTNGCAVRDELHLLVDLDRKVYIPSGFSPNGDGVNDLFMIYAEEKQIKKINYFRIFNRWGEIVFEHELSEPNNPAFGWDGRFRGQLMNPAVFVYIAEIEFIDGHVKQYHGDLTLFR